ncbi:uncharacterized protein RJT20DRAFT_129091 [Scheffersomyces xylosifermentans]|uniref:uncharacterized protein n=1 Tax=Scheffersomyces xylosifermentans TaxID=1304137 RepID=UPI00315C8E36
MAPINILRLLPRDTDDDSGPPPLKWLKLIIAVVFAVIVVIIILKIHFKRMSDLRKISAQVKYNTAQSREPRRIRIPRSVAANVRRELDMEETAVPLLTSNCDPPEPSHNRTSSISSEHSLISDLPPVYHDDRPPSYPNISS